MSKMSEAATTSGAAVDYSTIDPSQRIPVGEKIGYSLGDAAANFVFQTLMVFQLSFYTDTFGLAAAEAGTLLLVARVSDAFFDPLFGILSDRTSSRFGKFRPWIIATAVPYGILAVAAFTTPNFGHAGKLLYAYATYLGLMIVYSANNLPYSALSGVMTGEMGERTSLSSYRFFSAMSAAFVIQAIAPIMLKHLSHGSAGHYDPRAYQIVMTIFGAASIVFFIITFSTTRERIHPVGEQHASIGQDLLNLLKNGPWIALFFVTLLVFITLQVRGGTMIYYFQYYVGAQTLNLGGHALGRAIGPGVVAVTANTLFAWFNGFGLGANLIGIGFSKPLAMRFGKRNVFAIGLLFTAIITVCFKFFAPDQVVLMFAAETVRMFIYGTTIPLLWAMMADVADYSEWKTNRRATGIVFSAIVFGLKAGLGFGGAIIGWLLATYRYQGPIDGVPQVQSALGLSGIRLISSVYAAIPFFLAVICLLFYRINKSMEVQIAQELAERRRGTPPPPVIATEGIVLPEAP